MTEGDQPATEPAFIKVVYIVCCLTYMVVVTNSIYVLTIMIKHRTICDTDWRVKIVIAVYPLGAMLLCIYTFISRIWGAEINKAPIIFVGTACAWICVHWAVSIYYSRTARLLKVSFNQQEEYRRRDKQMKFIEIVGYSVVVCFMALYFIYLRTLYPNEVNIIYASSGTFIAISTSLMAILLTFAINKIEKETKSLALTGLSINIPQIRLYKWAFFLTCTCIWIYTCFKYLIVAKG